MKTIYFSICMFFAFSLQAEIFLNVTGGTGSSPLTIEITGGDTFTSVTDTSGDVFLNFQNFWDNNASSLTTGSSTSSFSLSTYSGSGNTGAVTTGPFVASTLLVGFTGGSIPTTGNTFALTTGTRVTDPLSLNYTTAGPVSGTVFVTNASGGVLSDTLNYTANVGVIPEPSTVSLLTIGCLVFFAAKLRKVK